MLAGENSMDPLQLTPLKQPVRVCIDIPGSKSYTNRALVMAALTKGVVVLDNPLYSEDTEAMIAALKTLGLRIETKPCQIIVHDDISVIQNKPYELFVQDSGTTIRFLLALLCLTPGVKVLKGNARLNERPIKDLVDALRLLGAKIDYVEKEGQAPLKIDPCSLRSDASVTLDASMSSQFLSALLMIAPFVNGLTIKLVGEVISRPYVEMTIDAMHQWGVCVLPMEQEGYHIPKGQHYQKKRYAIEGDFSSAGYFFAIGALTQSTITVRNVNPHSLQADRRLLEILSDMGNTVHVGNEGVSIVGRRVLPLSLNMETCPDLVQTVSVLAAFAKGVTTLRGVRSLRVKETERVLALKNELAKMGIKTEDTHDTLTIYGGSPHPAVIDTYGDHRMAMAFAVAGTQLPGMAINNPQVVNKTFPSFWTKLKECV